ncbi:MAG: c-type cytochrome [Niabella sp.]
MNKYLLIATVAASGILAGCGAGKNPGYAYMPDMYYSVANETYAPTTHLKEAGVNYNGLPVAGTVSRVDDLNFIYPYKNDSLGYALSATVKSPLDTLGANIDLTEAERLYQINCGICHGSKLDGNGPLFNGGDGPYSAAPKNFMDPAVIALADGTMFHSITYGIRAMGSYASQLTPKERWEIIAFIRSKQKGTAAPAPAADSATVAKN